MAGHDDSQDWFWQRALDSPAKNSTHRFPSYLQFVPLSLIKQSSIDFKNFKKYLKVKLDLHNRAFWAITYIHMQKASVSVRLLHAFYCFRKFL